MFITAIKNDLIYYIYDTRPQISHFTQIFPIFKEMNKIIYADQYTDKHWTYVLDKIYQNPLNKRSGFQKTL